MLEIISIMPLMLSSIGVIVSPRFIFSFISTSREEPFRSGTRYFEKQRHRDLLRWKLADFRQIGQIPASGRRAMNSVPISIHPGVHHQAFAGIDWNSVGESGRPLAKTENSPEGLHV